MVTLNDVINSICALFCRRAVTGDGKFIVCSPSVARLHAELTFQTAENKIPVWVTRKSSSMWEKFLFSDARRWQLWPLSLSVGECAWKPSASEALVSMKYSTARQIES